jgi:hypothetical protein
MNISNFAEYFRHDIAEIILLDEKVVRVGGSGDFFHSYCHIEKDLYSVNGRLPVLPYYRLGSPEFLNDQIFCNRYGAEQNGFKLVGRTALGRGGDPRVVSNQKKAYAISILVESDTNGRPVVGATLHDLREDRAIAIRVASPDFVYGKNWQPFLRGDELFVVHELTPFRILRVDTCSGLAEVVREFDISFKLPCYHTSYPMFRGGSNAVLVNGALLGIGRATSQRYRHHPFLWSFMDGHLEVLFTDFFYPFHKSGYNIIDPTSLFFDGEDLLFGLCCSERDWAHTQLVSNFLIRLRRSCRTERRWPLLDFFRERATTERNGIANLDRHMFFCIEMPTSIPSAHEFGGRASTGAPGHLVHGPYLRIEQENLYCAELSYLVRACCGTKVGNFEIAVSRIDESGKQGNFRTLARVDLIPTDGNMAEARLEFDTTGFRGMLLEFRVYVEEGIKMNAYHIRTWRTLHQSCRQYPWAPLRAEHEYAPHLPNAATQV